MKQSTESVSEEDSNESEAIIIADDARQRSEGSRSDRLISAMFIFNHRKVFAVLVSWLITRCFSMHTLTLFAKQLIFTPRLYVMHIRKRVTTDVALTIGSTMVGARLDYCNAILHEASKSNIQKLQRTQNSIAQLRFVNLFLTDICCVTNCLIIKLVGGWYFLAVTQQALASNYCVCKYKCV